MFGGFVCPVSMAEACVVVSLFLGASVEAGPVVNKKTLPQCQDWCLAVLAGVGKHG